MRTFILWTLRLLIAFGVVVVAVGVLITVRPDLAVSALQYADKAVAGSHSVLLQAVGIKLKGRSNGHSLAEVKQAVRYTQRLYSDGESIAAASRLITRDSGLELWNTPEGQWWAPAGDRDGLFGVLNEQRQDIYEHGSDYVLKDDVVLDVGAHVGIFTRRALRSGASFVIAVEPAPLTVECLRRNLAPEIGAGRVIVVPKGLMDKEGTMTMHVFHNWNSGMNSFAIEWEKGLPVVKLPVMTIDKLVAELKLSRLDFIKMDIEGAERDALAGAKGTLARFHPRLSIAAYHLPDDPKIITEIVLSAAKYKCATGTLKEWITQEIRPETLLFY